MRIDNDAAFKVEGGTGGPGVEVEALNVWAAANGDENNVSYELEKSWRSASWC